MPYSGYHLVDADQREAVPSLDLWQCAVDLLLGLPSSAIPSSLAAEMLPQHVGWWFGDGVSRQL